jgi:hypothetical protein
MPPAATPTIEDAIGGPEVKPPPTPAPSGFPVGFAAVDVSSGDWDATRWTPETSDVGASVGESWFVGTLAETVPLAPGVGSLRAGDSVGGAAGTGLGGDVGHRVGRGVGFGVGAGVGAGVGWAVGSGLLNGAAVGGATVPPGPPWLKRQS